MDVRKAFLYLTSRFWVSSVVTQSQIAIKPDPSGLSSVPVITCRNCTSGFFGLYRFFLNSFAGDSLKLDNLRDFPPFLFELVAW